MKMFKSQPKIMLKISMMLLLALSTLHVHAQEESDDLLSMSLEELLQLEVTSVSKKAERLQDVASAVYVISEEDIQRSGATRVTDLLQMHAPGLFFSYQSYDGVALGVRSKQEAFAGTVLVLVDNVPYQSPYSSGFDFRSFDFDLDEIDRIEVIRGPGGTIYGANAATGVINIFTKKNQDGWRTTVKQGYDGYFSPSVRYAKNVSENTHLKVFAKANLFDGFEPLDEFNGVSVTVPVTDMGIDPKNNRKQGLGTSSKDTTIINRFVEDIYRTSKVTGGLNVTSQLDESTSLSAHAYLYSHKFAVYRPSPYDSIGFFLKEHNNSRMVSSVRLDKSFTDTHSLFAQLSGNTEIDDSNEGLRRTHTLNLEIQDNFSTGIHNVSTGLTLRSVNFRIDPPIAISGFSFIRETAAEFLWGVFVQDQLRFSEKFDLTLGLKAETWTLIDNESELSPSLRMSFRPNKSLTIWGAASRSVTTPGFNTTDLELLVSPAGSIAPLDISVINSDKIDQTEYLTGELGIKASGSIFTVDVTGFYAQADDLLGIFSGQTPVPSKINIGKQIIPIFYANVEKSKNYGVETVVKLFPSPNVRFELSHAFLKLEREGKTNPATGEKIEITPGEAPTMPEHVFRLKSYFSFGNNYELTINNLYHTKRGSSNRFFYDQQRSASVGDDADKGIALNGPPRDHFRMDVKLEKFFAERKASIFMWGTDVLNTGRIDVFEPFQTGIPIQIHWMVGAGAMIKF